MAICPICGSNEFDIHEGLFYCRECNTQITESREEKDEIETESVFSGRSSKTSDRDKVSEEETRASKPWITTEAYNIILSKQVSSLISLGASPKLKSVVLQIWALYLQKCEIAFRKDFYSSDGIPALGLCPKQRDLQMLAGEKRSRIKFKKKIKKENVVNTEIDAPESGMDINNSALEMEVDDDLSVKSEVLSDAAKSTSGEESIYCPSKPARQLYSSRARSFMRKLGKRKVAKMSKTQINLPDHMVISKTLCFCYLGLLYVKDHILLCDLIRFVTEGRVPFFNTSSFLSHSIQLQVCDHKIVNGGGIPDMKNISKSSANLINFLNLPKFEHRSLLPIAARFVKDLNLPDKIIPMINTLVKKLSNKELLYEEKRISNSIISIPLYEVQAAAYIVLVLKMLFTLDGKTENEHSEIVKKINSAQTDSRLFVWDEWENFWKTMEPFLKTQTFSFTHVSEVDLLDVNSLTEYCSIISQQPSGIYLSKKKKKDQTLRKALKETMFSVASSRESHLNTATSFPLRSALGSLKMNAAALKPYSETNNFDFLSYEDFSSCSLSYIPQIDNLNNPELEELYGELGAKFYELKDCEENLDTHVFNSNYWHLASQAKKINKLLEMLPDTFKWLLNFISKSIQSNAVELYQEVVKMEKDLIYKRKEKAEKRKMERRKTEERKKIKDQFRRYLIKE